MLEWQTWPTIFLCYHYHSSYQMWDSLLHIIHLWSTRLSNPSNYCCQVANPRTLTRQCILGFWAKQNLSGFFCSRHRTYSVTVLFMPVNSHAWPFSYHIILHVFADASPKVFWAIVYTQRGKYPSLVISKYHVAPLKQQTLPGWSS